MASTARKLSQPSQLLRTAPATAVAERTAQIILGLFPEVSGSARATHKYFAKFLTAVGLIGVLALLGINTLLAEDAFKLSSLKLEAKAVADERDAINRSIDDHAAPEKLAAAAIALGMKPSDTPVFLDLTDVKASANG